uniref:Uncharacterized protein n=1 Tax=Odontella aurita TaxID=265563 RepID=A0A6U6CFY4_9STRA|mmetsp:Transcript_12515/g.36941  ORF Transcript_12515/g.36941 Transcript_12515/m.36941 type:complete len:121 (+) Transcript_12515:850-1212(+)
MPRNDDSASLRRHDGIESLLSSTIRNHCLNGQVFASESDFVEFISRDPPLVETKPMHGGPVPHPSFAATFDERLAPTVLDLHMFPMPTVVNNDDGGDGDHDNGTSPPLSFFLLFLGSVVA